MKTFKKKKFSLNKVTIARMANLEKVYGGKPTIDIGQGDGLTKCANDGGCGFNLINNKVFTN